MESNDVILKKLNQLEILIVSTAKQILTVEDLINYTGFSRSYIYKLVHNNILTYYKPNGKTLFFQKKEIDSFLLNNKSESNAQTKQRAVDYVVKSK